MATMTKRDEEITNHFLAMYKAQWDLNQYARDNYDDDLGYYLSYRNENQYPLAYNMSFNKLLPRIFTVLSRFMEQLYQAGTGDFVSVRPRKKSDVQRAPRVQGLLNYQLENLNDVDMQGGSYWFNFMWMFNALAFGKGICKVYWKREERITPRRIDIPIPVIQNGQLVGIDSRAVVIEAPQIVYDGPYAEILHNKLFVPHPHYRNIQQMPAVFCVYKRSLDYVKTMVEKGVYSGKYLSEIGFTGQRTGRFSGVNFGSDSQEGIIQSLQIERAISDRELDSKRITPEIDIVEAWGRVILPEDDAPYEVGRGYKIKGKESEVVAHIANYTTLLQIQKNNGGIRPFFDIGAYYHPELYWDIGIIRLGKDIQEQYNNLGNLRFQNAMMMVNQMLQVRQDADIDPAYLVWKPFGIIPVEALGQDVAPMPTADLASSGVFREQEQFFEETLSDMTGLYPYNMGQTPQRQEHVGTIFSLQSMGEARTKLLMMQMDHQGFRPFLKYMMYLNMLYLDPKTEARINGQNGTQFVPLFSGDLHVDYDFSARYTALEPSLGKQFRAQQLIQYAQMWQQSPFLNQYQFMKAVMELMDFHDPETYLKDPRQVAMEGQQVMQQQMQMHLAGAAVQDKLSAAQDERTLQREVVKGLLK